MSKYKDEDPNKRIVDLAAKVSEAKDKDIPKLILQLHDILDDCKDKGKQLILVKQNAWSFDLLHVLSLSLKQEFSKVEGQWQTAAKLISTLCNCCIGLEPTEEVEEFYDEFLPEAVDNCLVVAKKAQSRHGKLSKVLEDRKKAVFEAFKSIMESLVLLMSGHGFLATYLLQSNVFLQLLMGEEADMALLVLSTVNSANRMSEGVFTTLKPKNIQGLLDEIIYKLSATEDEKVASSAARTLLVVCDSHPPTVELLCKRYSQDSAADRERGPRGLGPLLKKWMQHGFDRDLRRLSVMLEAGSVQQAEEQKLVRAAKVIQAWWKSHYTRRKLKRANTAIAKFQKSFRSRKEQQQQEKEDEHLRTELQHQLTLRRKRAMRELHQRRLHAIEFLHPDEVDKHLSREQHDAATRVQKTFRGFITRKRIIKNREEKLHNEAAIKIQRGVRKWLRKVRSRRREPPNWQRPPGLTDARRVEIQEHINVWRDNHVTQAQTEEEREALHERVQNMLRREATVSRMTRKAQQRRQTLLAQLAVDSTLLMDGPQLADVEDQHLESYMSYSVPVATRARFNHSQEMRLLQQPWWKKLGDEYQDAKIDEELNWKVF